MYLRSQKKATLSLLGEVETFLVSPPARIEVMQLPTEIYATEAASALTDSVLEVVLTAE
jgi:hypothetical protein